jgi:hypothetical protein
MNQFRSVRHSCFAIRCWLSVGLLFVFAADAALAQQQPKPEPDVLVLVDGERLVGQFVESTGATLTFKSDLVGQVILDWSKVQEFHSVKAFALLPKEASIERHADTSSIPQGTVEVSNQRFNVTPRSGAPRSVAIADADHVVEEGAFQNAVENPPGLLANWKGSITGGATLVQATQESRTFTGAISLNRIDPEQDWLRKRNRTEVDFTASYGTVRQPATPEVKTEIYHAALQRDEYFTQSWFGFGQASFDHNFSQGLDLQQTYGGGLGWSVLKRGNESLELKGAMTYIRQQFSQASSNQNLIGSTFEEDFKRGLRYGATFTQQLILIPAWNNADALSAAANALLTMPVYKQMNFSFGVIDNYLHNPPIGFKKNSFQLTAGVTYTVR